MVQEFWCHDLGLAFYYGLKAAENVLVHAKNHSITHSLTHALNQSIHKFIHGRHEQSVIPYLGVSTTVVFSFPSTPVITL